MSHYVEPKKRIPEKLTDPLAYAFGFDRGDLQDNRLGFISHWQKSRLRWHILSYTWSILTWIFFLIVVPFAFGISSLTETSYLVAPFMLWTVLALTLFGGFWVRHLGTVLRDLRQRKVTSLTGMIDKHRRERKATYAWNERSGEYTAFDYFIVVDNQQFEITRDQFNAFKNFQTYTLYIASASRQILSADLVHDDTHQRESDYDEGVLLTHALANSVKPQQKTEI